MAQKFSVVALHEYRKAFGDDTLNAFLHTFSCSKDDDIQAFLHEKAVISSSMHTSESYFVLDDNDNLSGFFTLALKPVVIAGTPSLSNQKKKQINRYAPEVDGKRMVAAYLIAQLARNDCSEKIISGAELLAFATGVIRMLSSFTGGGIIIIECRKIEKLVDFYKRNGFIIIGTRVSSDGSEYYQMITTIKHEKI